MMEYGFKIPTTGEDWQLYSSMTCGRAARALTAVLKKSFKAVERGFGKEPVAKLLGRVMREVMDPALSKYSKFGAEDTEPIYVAKQALINFAKMKLYGTTEGYYPELGDEM